MASSPRRVDACDEAEDPERYEVLADAEIEAQKVVYGTKPTTIAGVMTLASYLAVDENCDDACIGDLALKQGLLTIAGALADIEGKRLEAAAAATRPALLLGVRDRLGDVRSLLRGLKLAVAGLESEDDEPVLAIGSIVEDKLDGAIDALDEIRSLSGPEREPAAHYVHAALKATESIL